MKVHALFGAMQPALAGLGAFQSYHVEDYTDFATTRSVDLFGDVSAEVVKNLTLTAGLLRTRGRACCVSEGPRTSVKGPA